MKRFGIMAVLVVLLVPPGQFRFSGGTSSSLFSSLVSYWKLDELLGTRAKAAGTCAACDLTAVNAPAATGGIGRFAAFLNGTSQVFTIADAAAFNHDGATTLGACHWVLPGTIDANDTSISKQTEYQFTNAGYTFFGPGAGTSVTANLGTSSYASGVRGFYCGWWDASTLKGYASLNGAAPIVSATTIVSLNNDANAFVVGGRNAASRFFGGTVGPVWFYKGSIPPYASLYNSGLGYTCAGTPAGLRTNLIACWNLSEASGTRAESGIGSCGTPACDLTAVNAPPRSAGLILSSMGMSTFSSAAGTYLTTSGDPAYTATMTVNGWVNTSSATGLLVFSKANEMSVYPAAGVATVDCVMGTSATVTTGTVVNGTWHMITGVCESGVGRQVCLDATCSAVSADADSLADTASAVVIGQPVAGGIGSTDAVGWWGRTLTAPELTALYAAGAGVEYPWATIVDLFQPSVRWADLPLYDRQRIVFARTGVVVPEFMFPTRKVSIR